MSIVDELIALLGFEVTGEEEARRFEQRLESLNDGLDKFATNAGRIAGYAAVAVSGSFGLLGRSVIDTSAQFEVYQATLETIEGSAEKARASLDWIADFGKTTPYDVQQVTDAFVALKAYGIDPIADDALRTLGDTASAMGKPLTQAVEAFADAATGEFERLKEFGIRSSTVGDNVTFSWTKNGEELTQTVRKNSSEIRAFLLETMGDRFSGAMDRQSRTWHGMMSNLGDTWTDFKRRIGEGGFFDVMTGHLGGLLEWLGRLDADGTLDRWATNLSDTLSATANFFAIIAERIGTNIMFLIENFDSLQGPLIMIGAILGFLIARAFPLITIFSVLALVVDDFLAYLQGGESFIGDFIAKLQELTGVSEEVAEALAGLSGVVAFALGSAFLIAPGKTLKLFSMLLVGGIKRIVPRVFAALMGIGPAVKLALAFARRTLFAAIIAWGPGLLASLAALGPMIMKGAAAAFALLSNPIGWAILLAGVGAGLIWYFWDEISEAWAGIKERLVEMFTGIGDWVMDIDWTGLGSSMANAIWDGLKSVGGAIKDWFNSLIPAWARDWFDDGAPEEPPAPQSTDERIADENTVMAARLPRPAVSLSTLPPAAPSGEYLKHLEEIEARQQARYAEQAATPRPIIYQPSGDSFAIPAPVTPEPIVVQTSPEQAELARNLEAYLARIDSEQAGGSVEAVLNDSRADNRQFPMSNTVTIHQNVTRAVDAPRRVAEAVGNATSNALPTQRTQAEMEPSF